MLETFLSFRPSMSASASLLWRRTSVGRMSVFELVSYSQITPGVVDWEELAQEVPRFPKLDISRFYRYRTIKVGFWNSLSVLQTSKYQSKAAELYAPVEAPDVCDCDENAVNRCGTAKSCSNSLQEFECPKVEK